MRPEALIEADNLAVGYEGTAVVSGVTFTLRAGDSGGCPGSAGSAGFPLGTGDCRIRALLAGKRSPAGDPERLGNGDDGAPISAAPFGPGRGVGSLPWSHGLGPRHRPRRQRAAHPEGRGGVPRGPAAARDAAPKRRDVSLGRAARWGSGCSRRRVRAGSRDARPGTRAAAPSRPSQPARS